MIFCCATYSSFAVKTQSFPTETVLLRAARVPTDPPGSQLAREQRLAKPAAATPPALDQEIANHVAAEGPRCHDREHAEYADDARNESGCGGRDDARHILARAIAARRRSAGHARLLHLLGECGRVRHDDDR